MAYLSNLAANLTPYTAGEQPRNRKYIKLNTNENPYPPSPKVKAAIDAAYHRLPLYPDMEATLLSQAIGHVTNLPEDWVFCGNGSDEVLAFAFAAFFAGKKLYAPDITYSFYPVYAQLFQVAYHTIPLLADFSVDVQGLCQDGPIALANPNAPTGRLLPLEEVRKLALHGKAIGEVVLIDEAYTAFAPENALPLLAEFDNLLIVRTFSKSHSLAGLRVGYALGHPRLIAGLNLVKNSFNSYPLDCLAQAAATAAITDTAYNKTVAEQIVSARDWTYQALQEAGFSIVPSAANFLFVKADNENAAPYQQQLKEHGILVRHFSAPRIAPYLRISIGTQGQMEEVVKALISIGKS